MAECSLSMREVLGSIPDFSSDSFLVGHIIHSNIIRQVLIFMIEFQYGDVAHMVERSLSMREVLGSMPNFSTLFFPFNFIVSYKLCFFLSFI